jgi:hypothetical protein
METTTAPDLPAVVSSPPPPAIASGQTTCVAIVQHYLARAYIGVASMLVTPDGAPVPDAPGVVCAQWRRSISWLPKMPPVRHQSVPILLIVYPLACLMVKTLGTLE